MTRIAPLPEGPRLPGPPAGGLVARLRRVGPLDWLMLALALVSIGLLSYETWGPVDDEQRRDILLADTVICGIFLLEFLWRWGNAGWRREFVWRNWYEILGMIPLAHPAIRGFRLFRILRIVILLSRFGMAADRALGEDFTFLLVRRFRHVIVDSISESVTVAVLDQVAEVLQKGHYVKNVARAFEQNQAHVRAMALEHLKEDPQLRRFSRIPFFDDLVEAMVGVTLRVLKDFLEDPRTDDLMADVLRENLQQIRAAVREKEVAREAREQAG
jgi:voltage-gated potassium channel